MTKLTRAQIQEALADDVSEQEFDMNFELLFEEPNWDEVEVEPYDPRQDDWMFQDDHYYTDPFDDLFDENY